MHNFSVRKKKKLRNQSIGWLVIRKTVHNAKQWFTSIRTWIILFFRKRNIKVHF